MNKKKVGLALLSVGIIVLGAVVSLVLGHHFLGILITVPGFMIFPSFNLPSNLDKYYYAVTLGFDIFCFGFFMYLLMFGGYEKIAEALGISSVIVLVAVAWGIIGILELGSSNLDTVIELSKRNKKVKVEE